MFLSSSIGAMREVTNNGENSLQSTSWSLWLLLLTAVALAEAQYKFRRPPLPPPPPQIFKKSWAPGARIPPMGNSIHLGQGFPHKRPLYKPPPNYRWVSWRRSRAKPRVIQRALRSKLVSFHPCLQFAPLAFGLTYTALTSNFFFTPSTFYIVCWTMVRYN